MYSLGKLSQRRPTDKAVHYEAVWRAHDEPSCVERGGVGHVGASAHGVRLASHTRTLYEDGTAAAARVVELTARRPSICESMT